MPWWVAVDPGIVLVIMTIGLKQIRTRHDRRFERANIRRYYTIIRVMNDDRRLCLRMSWLAIILVPFGLRWPPSPTWSWSALNVLMIGANALYWSRQPRTRTEYKFIRPPD